MVKGSPESLHKERRGVPPRRVDKKCQERNEIDELRILRALQDCSRGGAQEIIRRLGITKSRAYKLMSELKDCCILP